MRITKEHLDYWCAKKAPIPTWASDLPSVKSSQPCIHQLINDQVSVRDRDTRDWTLVIERTLITLKSQQRREGLKGMRKGLLDMSSEGGARGALCKRLIRRIGHRNVDFNILSERLIEILSDEYLAILLSKNNGAYTYFSHGTLRINYTLIRKDKISPLIVQALKAMDAVDLEKFVQEYL